MERKLGESEDIEGYVHGFEVWAESASEALLNTKKKIGDILKLDDTPRGKIMKIATVWESCIDLHWYLLKRARQSSRQMARTRGVENMRSYNKSVKESVDKALQGK